MKSESSGSMRWIAKQLLNCLYGVFGRKKDTTTVLTVSASDLPLYLTKNIVTSIIQISPNIYSIKIKNNIDHEILSELNSYVEDSFNFRSVKTLVKNNVAIAAATTAYARIYMMPFKLDPSCAYSDTDSVFTRDELGLVAPLLDDKPPP